MNELADTGRWLRIALRLPHLASLAVYPQRPDQVYGKMEVIKKSDFDAFLFCMNSLQRLILVDWETKNRANLLNLKDLTALTHLSYHGIGEGIGDVISNLKSLRELNLCRCLIRDARNCFCDLSKNPYLTSLSLSNVQGVDFVALQELSACSNLLELTLSGTGSWVDDECVTCPPLISSLQRLCLAECVLDPSKNDLDHILWLDMKSTLPMLQSLVLYNVMLPEYGERLVEHLIRSAIQSLSKLIICVDGSLSFLKDVKDLLNCSTLHISEATHPSDYFQIFSVRSFFHRKVMQTLGITSSEEARLWDHKPYQQEALPLSKNVLHWDERIVWSTHDLFSMRFCSKQRDCCARVQAMLPSVLSASSEA